MNIKVNGENVVYENSINITKLLESREVKVPGMVSVRINDKIISSADRESTMIKDGDEIEFLYFMGGGSNSESS